MNQILKNTMIEVLRHLYFSIAVMLFPSVLGCHEKKNVENNTVVLTQKDDLYRVKLELPDKNKLKDLYLSEIADSIYYVTINDSRIINPSGLYLTDSGDFIANGGVNGNLELYDINGNFKKRIGSVGRGPGEYMWPNIVINQNTKKVFLASTTTYGKLMIYDIDGSSSNSTGEILNGRFNRIEGMHFIGNNILFIHPNNTRKEASELQLYDFKNNTFIDSISNYASNIPSSTILMEFNGSRAFGMYDNEGYYSCMYSDTLYRITERAIEPFVVFDYGKYRMIAELKTSNASIKDYSSGKLDPMDQFAGKMYIKTIIRSGNILYIRISYTSKDNPLSFIYALNLENGEGIYYNPAFINDLDNGPDYYGDNSKLPLAELKVNPDDTKLKNSVFPNNNISKKLRDPNVLLRIFENVTENSNPVFMYIKRK